MRNVLSRLLCLILVCSPYLLSCGDDDDKNEESGLQEKYITVDNGTYMKGSLPVGSNTEMLEDVTLGGSALPGGSSFLKLASKEVLKAAYITVSGEEGYIQVDLKPDNAATNRSTETRYTYTVILSVSQQLNSDFTIELTAVNAQGDVSAKVTKDMKYVQAGTGALQVNLHFSNAKDLDLYVVEPNGNIICYDSPFPYCSDAYRRFEEMNNGGEYNDEDDFPGAGLIGLDVDSNAGCDIDNINSENVFFTPEVMQKGTYQVWVNLYENCNSAIATDYIVKATYKGKAVSTTWGANPAQGVFPVGARGNNIGIELTGAVKMMEFTINEGVAPPQRPAASASKASLKGFSKKNRVY